MGMLSLTKYFAPHHNDEGVFKTYLLGVKEIVTPEIVNFVSVLKSTLCLFCLHVLKDPRGFEFSSGMVFKSFNLYRYF